MSEYRPSSFERYENGNGYGSEPTTPSAQLRASADRLRRPLSGGVRRTGKRLAFQGLKMEPAARAYFRDELREARSAAFRDAEGFQAIVFAIERLGSALKGRAGALRDYEDVLANVARRSTLAEQLPQARPEWHAPFWSLYRLVRQGRNDALHQGAYARRLADHAVQLSLILEDALMEGENLVRDFMVRDVACAVPWQPMSAARQLMLANSFSFLPILAVWDLPARWLLMSDYGIAKFLRGSPSPAERNRRLATTGEGRDTVRATRDRRGRDVRAGRRCGGGLEGQSTPASSGAGPHRHESPRRRGHALQPSVSSMTRPHAVVRERPNSTIERPAGSQTLAAAAHRERSAHGAAIDGAHDSGYILARCATSLSWPRGRRGRTGPCRPISEARCATPSNGTCGTSQPG